MRSGNYSWVGDIRARVALAKNTSRSEADFMEALRRLGIDVADNSSKARRDDWIYSLADEPTKKVSGEEARLHLRQADAQEPLREAVGHTIPSGGPRARYADGL